MKFQSGLITAALLATAGLAGAADNHSAPLPNTDAGLAENVRHAIAMYPYYSIWDDVAFDASEGTVHLTGEVNIPVKKSDIDKIVRNVPGVKSVEDEIRVLPLSPNDDRLRLQVARAIYGDPTMLRYAMQPLKTIHIIVENGHVTLTGVVSSDFDKQMAATRASMAGMSFGTIDNQLQVVRPSKKS